MAIPKLQRTSALGEAWATILVAAPPRWGKTRLIRGARKPLVLACEMGARRGLGTLSDLDIPFFPCDTIEQLLEVARELGKNRERCTFEGEEFEHVFLDSASVAGELGLEGAKKQFNWGDFLWDATKGSGKDPRKAYPYMNEKIRHLMKLLFDIQAHFIAIAREAKWEEKDSEGNTLTWMVPEFPGTKLPMELPGWPDATLRGDFVNGVRLLRTKTHLRAVAGIRVPDNVPNREQVQTNVPDFLIPDINAICSWMRGWKPEDLEKCRYKPPPKQAAPNAPPRK